jgi:hypothetical protein
MSTVRSRCQGTAGEDSGLKKGFAGAVVICELPSLMVTL